MIQELFRGTNVSILGGERSNLSTQILDPSPSSSPSPSSYVVSDTPTTTTPPPAHNLRCPRCDSSNTKFCYYNNYNLTQPRHFCKTCRRYWTKGGTLRNIPIGGSFRKNKTATAINSAAGKSFSAPGKLIKSDIGKSTLFNGFDQSELPSNPLYNGSHHSHLLSLHRQNPNPNPNVNFNPKQIPSHIPNHVSKEEGLVFGSSHFISNGLNERALGIDSLGPLQVPSIGLANSYYRNQGIFLGGAENNGLQELYQRLRSTRSSYPEHASVILGHVASGGTNNSAILDSAPFAQGGFLNPTLYWQPNDLPTTNGAYP